MQWVLLFAALAAVAAASEDAGQFNYLVLASKYVEIGEKYKIGFGVRGGDGIKSVSARIFTENARQGYQNISVQAEEGSSDGKGSWSELELLLEDEPSAYDQQAEYKLSTRIEDMAGRVFNNETKIFIRLPQQMSLVQTDKGVYQPGQTVKYRIVTLDNGLKPVLANTKVVIKDSRRNMIYSTWHNASDNSMPQTVNMAVAEGSLPLSEMPIEGTWTIEAVSDYSSETKYFEVKRYVLPKFTLDVQLPSFVHFNDTQFKVKVTVSYTFNKAVEGRMKMTLGPYRNCRSCKPRYDMQRIIEIDNVQKQQQFAFNLTEWRQMLREDNQWRSDLLSTYNARCSVEFTEKFTGVKKTETKDFTIYTTKHTVQIKADESQFFIPGGKVPLAIRLMRPDNQPFTEASSSQVTVTIIYNRRGKRQAMEVYNGMMSPAATGTGVSLMATVPADADFERVQFVAKIATGDKSSSSVTVVPYMAYSDEFVSADFVVDEENQFLVKTEQSSGIVFRMMAAVSRDQLQKWQLLSSDTSDDRVQLFDNVCSQCYSMLPEVTAVVFGVTRSGEIVASAATQKLDSVLKNVTLSSNLTGSTGQPQQYASIKVTAEPGSFVFLAGIDHSVNLLRSGNDILRNDVVMVKPVSWRRRGPWFPGPQSVNTKDVLNDASLIVMSDGFYYDAAQPGPNMEFSPALGSPRFGGGSLLSKSRAPASPNSADSQGTEQTQLRKFFPETMIWSVVKTDESGKGEHSLQLPDSITSWDITAFGLTANEPIQTMTSPMKLVTQKSFFVQPVLPVSIVRGEKFILKVLTFNYLVKGEAINVSLQLDDSFEAKPLSGQNTWTADGAVGVEVPASETQSVSAAAFEIVALKLRQMPIRVSGVVSVGAGSEQMVTTDIVQRQLLVVPEGVTVRRTAAMLLGLDDADSVKQNVSIAFPADEDMVSDSEIVSLTVIGDVLGPAMQNIGQLIRMPSGCGEQNLVRLAPAVSIARYLSSVADNQQAAMRKAVDAMLTGYQRQLRYRRSDGSYSAFGEKDKIGSVWLTAFTLRTYARAADFVTIDPQALSGSSLRFLLDVQAGNGAFSELPGGRVFDQSLQGEAASGSLAMTAFVCSSLLDIQQTVSKKPELQTTSWKSADVDGALNKCLWHLQGASASAEQLTNSLDVSLAAYTLARFQTDAKQLWQRSYDTALAAMRSRLREMVVEKEGRTYWQIVNRYGWKRDSVESTAYALLDAVLLDDGEAEDEDQLQLALPMLRWLTDKQSNLGGFGSTQSTVMGIRSLTEFATKFSVSADSDDSAVVTVLYNSQRSIFTVDSTNRRVLQSQLLARGAADSRKISGVSASANGSGTALVTVAWQYNVIGQLVRQLTADWLTGGQGLSLRLGEKVAAPVAGGVGFTVCATASANITSGMYILTVTDPSGHSPVEFTPPSEALGLRRVEDSDGKVVFYFNALTKPVCVYAKWQRDVPMLSSAPQTITLQKYYQPELNLTASYSAPELIGLSQCQACVDCPGCSGFSSLLKRMV